MTIILYGCISASKTPTDATFDDYNDVLLLTSFIQDHLRKSDELHLNLDQLIENDSLERISKSFKKIDFKPRGGHISIHYAFSDSRNINGIELTEKEKEKVRYYKLTIKDLKVDSDGEIKLDYGERFYRVIKITVNSKAK